jgi:hypothetical protein
VVVLLIGRDCWSCGDDDGNDEWEDDPINFGSGECWNTCTTCDGRSGWHYCPTFKQTLARGLTRMLDVLFLLC